ncbi:sensor histidine kinase [Candidatus Solirubrobacter pratensis]|uniref:sensor histidine kinase n=1 Tax=Candidatus Solirubrobacter pratensis TaxID=1298857 RepID=UPI0004195ADD|nr:sensor histidine kinase [Candidatus Solirubrobacter pratensis]
MLRRRADVLLALLLAVPSVVQAVVWPIAAMPVSVLIALCSTLPIAWRRTHPIVATLIGTAVWFIPTDGYIVTGYIAAFILYYSLAAHVEDVEPVAAVTAFGVAVSITGSWINGEVAGEYFGAVSAVLLPAVAGRVVRRQRAQTSLLRKLTGELERERERTAELAVAEERARIARELHDVVAHALSVIAIQSDGADAALDAEPERARRPLRVIRRSAEEALGEMRRLVGVLRDQDEGESLQPQPGLAQLPGLVERARAAGMPVTLHVEGQPRHVPAGLDLSAFRIVQEALTNVHKHAHGSPATVRVVWERRELSLQVRDGGSAEKRPANGDGHGLVGMRERVRLHGGELHAGRLPGGGFEVRAVLPL